MRIDAYLAPHYPNLANGDALLTEIDAPETPK
jgi:hypothetical protein